jgi:hypothetical protein
MIFAIFLMISLKASSFNLTVSQIDHSQPSQGEAERTDREFGIRRLEQYSPSQGLTNLNSRYRIAYTNIVEGILIEDREHPRIFRRQTRDIGRASDTEIKDENTDRPAQTCFEVRSFGFSESLHSPIL